VRLSSVLTALPDPFAVCLPCWGSFQLDFYSAACLRALPTANAWLTPSPGYFLELHTFRHSFVFGTDEDWGSGYVRTLGMLLDGRAMTEWAASGELVRDEALLCLFNAFWEPIDFLLPSVEGVSHWEVLVNTYQSTAGHGAPVTPCSQYRLEARSLVLMASPRP